jgi:hypothetical protein
VEAGSIVGEVFGVGGKVVAPAVGSEAVGIEGEAVGIVAEGRVEEPGDALVVLAERVVDEAVAERMAAVAEERVEVAAVVFVVGYTAGELVEE